MRRPFTAALALLFVYLVVSVQPVAAANTVGAYSVHTTNADFNNADTLENVSVDSGAVKFLTDEHFYNPIDDDGAGNRDRIRELVGDDTFDNTISTELRIQPDDTGNITNLTVNIDDVDGSDPGTTVDVYIVQEPTPDENYGEGTKVATWDPDWSTGDQTIELDTEFAVSADTNYSIEFVTGSTDSDGTQDILWIAQDNAASTTWFSNTRIGTMERFADVNVSIKDTAAKTGKYISQNHTVTNSNGGFVNFTQIDNTTATVTWTGYDGGTSTQLAQQTISTAGNHSFSWSTFAGDEVQVNFTFDSPGLPTTEMVSEGVDFENNDPTVDNSSAQLQGNPQVTSTPIKLNITVNDSDFATQQGDEVTAEFFVNGSSVGTDTLTANGTAEVSYSVSIGGQRQWHVELSDSYGGSNTSDTFLFETPSTIQIREESEPHALVKQASVEVRIFGSNNTLDKRTVSDGNISLTGLPIDESYVFVINASGYHQQSIIIDDIFAQSTVFVLNKSLGSIENRFTITDLTGDYMPIEDVSFKIQKSVNRSLYDPSASTGYQWTTIAGDRLGAEAAYTVDLKEGDRYRLVIVDPEGNERVLGPYTAETTGTISVTIAEDNTIQIRAENANIGFAPDVGTLPARDTVNISASIAPGDTTFTSYELEAIYNDGSTNTTLATTSGSQASGEVIDESLNLSGKAGGTLYAVVNYTTSSGFSGTASAAYRIHESYGSQYSVLSVIPSITARLPGDSASVFTAMLSFLLVALGTTAVTQQLNLGTEIAGLVAVGGFVMFALIGWLAWQYVFAVGATWAFVTAIRRGL